MVRRVKAANAAGKILPVDSNSPVAQGRIGKPHGLECTPPDLESSLKRVFTAVSEAAMGEVITRFSTGGEATLDFLEGRKLAGIAALEENL